MSRRGWIGVDLDGTLAHYEGWVGIDHIGKPIPAMVRRVKEWLGNGIEVRVFTARAFQAGPDLINAIQDWTEEHIGVRLSVTCTKDYSMIELWDDRAVRVVENKGLPCSDHHTGGARSYFVKDESLELGTPSQTLRVAYSKIDGSYIGTEEIARDLEELGIAPQAFGGRKTASIGYDYAKDAWWGWSHRAMTYFTVGSKVAFGDVAYIPADYEDACRCAVSFYSDEYHSDVKAELTSDAESVYVTWTYTNDTPNHELRGTPGQAYVELPEKWGRGEWTAETLEDAKQMAMDFAEAVS